MASSPFISPSFVLKFFAGVSFAYATAYHEYFCQTADFLHPVVRMGRVTALKFRMYPQYLDYLRLHSLVEQLHVAQPWPTVPDKWRAAALFLLRLF